MSSAALNLIGCGNFPTAPSSSDPYYFNSQADSFFNLFPQLAEEVNDFISSMNSFGSMISPDPDFVLTTDTTVNITPSMTRSQIQSAINAVPKNLNGHTVTFQFASGTYSFTDGKLLFFGFHGGTVIVQGDVSDNYTFASKAVMLSSSYNSDNTIRFSHCFATVIVRSLSFTHSGGAATNVYVYSCSDITFDCCSFVHTAYTHPNLYISDSKTGRLTNNYFAKGSYGLYVGNSTCVLESGNETYSITPPSYGIGLIYGAEVSMLQLGLYGGTADYVLSPGSIVFLSKGAIKIYSGEVIGA